MTGDTGRDEYGERLWRSLERHELAVKRAVESVGTLEDEFDRVATEFEDEGVREVLADLGRAIETHEEQMELVMDTLNQHKGVIQEPNDLGARELEQAMERARRKAREESRPPGLDSGSGGDRDAGP